MKKIVIASDSFKGSLSSAEVAEAAAIGIRMNHPSCEIIGLSIGDGGEGTCEAIARTMPCKWTETEVSDPLGRNHTARYALCESSEGLTAVIELAQASGLTLLSAEELDPMNTSTYGTGQMIMDASARGCRRFMIGLGGSATNDGGTGLLEALGYRFIDDTGKPVRRCCGGKLCEIASIDATEVPLEILSSSFTIACDVDTPFYGPEGASRIFAPQKGASEQMVEVLEEGMQSFAEVIRRKYGINLSLVKGSGAAGGTAGALHAILGAGLCKGADLVLDAVRFEETIEGADLIITGEGRIDSQTFRGKLPSIVLRRAAAKGIPVIAIGGIVDLDNKAIQESGFAKVVAIQPRPKCTKELSEAMTPTTTARNIIRTISSLVK